MLVMNLEKILGPCLDMRFGITEIACFVIKKDQSLLIVFLELGSDFPEKSPQMIIHGRNQKIIK